MATKPQQDTKVDSAPDADRSDDEFSAALGEALSDKEPAPAPAAAAEDRKDSPTEGADEDKAPAQDAAADEAADDKSPAENPQDDPWANAPPELRELREKERRDEELRLKSLQGRQSALDRELERLRNQPGQAKQDGKEQSDASGEGEEQDGGDDPLSSAELKQLEEDYPEVAGPLLGIIRKQNEQLGKLSKVGDAFTQREQSAAIERETNLLNEQHPDWQEVIGDERFGGWLQDQPKSVQEALARNFEAIVDGKDAALVVGKFKSDLGIGGNNPTPAPSDTAPDDRRKRQIAAGRDAGGNGPAVASGIPDDFNSAADAFLKD